ncbi:MAG TPA: alpha/beta hydrolase [Polyangiaceae bacterium]|nr:alpha/beta hydrolase [Polyangiaceae bacterium]
MKKHFWPSLALMLAAGALLPTASRAATRSFLFPASQAAEVDSPVDFVRHTLAAADGVAVHALELPAPPGGRTVVHFHNNRETAEAPAGLARSLHALGLGVVLVEYRGYGASRGFEPSEAGLYLDAEAALGMLAARGVGPERVVLWGTSLGTGVAAEMARRGRGSGLVLVTPYTSIPDLVTGVAPFVPARTLLADHFDTLSKADAIRMPTLVIHGDADEIVPYAMGERVAGAIAGARLVRVDGGRHGDLFLREGRRLLGEIAALGT